MGALARQWKGLVLVGAVLAIAAVFAPGAVQRWNARPPSAACRARTFDVTLAGLGLKVPASPLLKLSTGKGADGGYDLAAPLQLRDFCDRSPPERPARITAIRLDLDPGGPCRNGRDRLAAVACPDAGRWTRAAIYSPAEFDHLALGSSLGAYESFRRERAVTEVNEAPMEAVRVGAFERYPDGFWVAPDWMTASGEPVAISCSPDHLTPGWLACTTTHAVGAGLQATLDFRAPEAEVEATARRIEADLTLTLATFAPGQGLGMTPPPAS
ncbi:hypothetical protein ACO2Q3_18000 [Caulobacter sp. KR2-114]|uniref:hypothetical protein n=1 Tax=Caulobacter sp. KR2-114 TaxID=3400912 RepID=UPI003C0BB855